MSPKAARAPRGLKRSSVQAVEGSRSRSTTATPAAAAALSQPRLLLAALLPVVAAIVVYIPALRNGFIWDDPLVLRQLRAIESFGDLLVPPAVVPKFYFRPVIFVSYLIDRALLGEMPFWFHASVVALHAVNTLLVFLLARRLFPADWFIAAGGALLFAVFPTHVESVAWMAGRSDVIVCMFVLLTVLLHLDRERRGAAWLAGLTFLLAALSKEMALACVILLPLLDLLRTRRLQWSRYVPLLLATAIYLGLRAHALGAVVGGVATGLSSVDLAIDLLRAVGFYTIKAIVPVGLCAYIPEVPAAPVYLLTGAVVLPLAVGLIILAVHRGHWTLGFLGVWFFVALVPSLTVIVRHSASAVVADRYLYVPTVASCILLAWAVARAAQTSRLDPRWPAGAIILLSVLFAAQVVPYTRVWADNLAFWTDVAAKVPDDALPQRELATALLERGQLADAERALQRALGAKSDVEGRVMTYGNLGNLYRRQGRLDEAQQAFETALQLGPHPALLHNIGMTRVEQAQRQSDQAAALRDIRKAREAFEQALELGERPGLSQTFREQWEPAKTHALLGQVLFSLGDRAAAREQLETALRLQPTGPVADVTRQYMQKVGL